MTRLLHNVRLAVALAMFVALSLALNADVPHVASGTWVSSGDVAGVASGAASAALSDGRIVIAGGSTSSGEPTAAITIYDPASASIVNAGAMLEGRSGHALTLLQDGRVLIAGGTTPNGLTTGLEIFDPSSGVTLPAGEMSMVRVHHAAATLDDGRVLIAGGSDGSAAIGIAEIFNPVDGTTSAVPDPMVSARGRLSATTLLDGRVLLAGGNDGASDLATLEIYDPVAQTFSPSAAALGAPRTGHLAMRLPHNGSVLIAGGAEGGTAVAVAETYLPWTDSISAAASMPAARIGAVGGGLQSDAVAVVTGGGAASVDFFGYATLQTDKDDYAPGQTVTITGRGWQPGETVTMLLEEVGDLRPARTLTAIASDSGVIVNTEFAPEEHHIGVHFYLTARGAASQARTTFTDSVSSVIITAPLTQQTFTSLPASITVSFNYSTSAGPTVGTAEIVGTMLSQTKALTAGAGLSDSITINIPAGTANGTYNLRVRVDNNTGSGANQRQDVANGIVNINVPTDTTAPIVTPNVNGTLGTNGWYTGDVTVSWSVTDPESIVTTTGCEPVIINLDTTGTTLACSAASAGGSTTQSVTIRRDASPPTATLTPNGTLGLNGWYTSDVTVVTTGADSISGPVTCTSDQFITAETTAQSIAGSCTNDAGLTTDATPLTIKLDKTGPSAALAVTAGTAGANGWYTSDVAVTTSGEDLVSAPVTCSAVQDQTAETTGKSFGGSCTNAAGLTTEAAPIVVKVDKTAPTGVVLGVIAGTEGSNGWYITDVTLRTSSDPESISGPVTCTAEQLQAHETQSQTFNGSCTNDAGLTASAAAVTIKLDKTGPTATLAVTAGAAGANGWHTSDVTIETSGNDAISAPLACTGLQFQTAETSGTPFNGSCTNDAGLTTEAAALVVKLDKTGPSAALAVTAGTLGNNGWYVSNVTIGASGTESISNPVICSGDQFLTVDAAAAVFNGSCTNAAGLTTNAASLTIKRDATAPVLSPLVTPNPVVLNGSATVSAGAADAMSGLASATCGSLMTTTVGAKTVTCSATDQAGNTSHAEAIYSVVYGVGTCLGAPGHMILQPVNADGSSVFKQRSTIPAKFRVCDANGVSVGTPGVVQDFRLVQVGNGTLDETVNELVESTTPDLYFRWSPTDQQWIFNINTKSLMGGKTYAYRITLDDGSAIEFRHGLR